MDVETMFGELFRKHNGVVRADGYTEGFRDGFREGAAMMMNTIEGWAGETRNPFDEGVWAEALEEFRERWGPPTVLADLYP